MTLEKFVSELEKGGYYNIDIIPVENYTGMFKVYFDNYHHSKCFKYLCDAKKFSEDMNNTKAAYYINICHNGKFTPYFEYFLDNGLAYYVIYS